MAFREITLTEEEMQGGGNYWKANAIGDKFGGLFLRTQESTGQFKRTEWIFRVKNADGTVSELNFSAPTDADRKLKKANLKPGHKVIVKYTSDLPMGEGKSPMKIFSVMVDDSAPALAAPKPAPVPAPKPPAPAPAADPLDDVAF